MYLGASPLDWMSRIAAIALAICALELLIVRRALADTGVFGWPVLRGDYRGAGRWIADRLFAYPSTLGLLVLQLVVAAALPWTPRAALPWLGFATTLAIAVRFRGAYNGGSDSMLLVVTLSLAVARTVPTYAHVALGYCAVQLSLSYFLAGIAKLGDRAWRDGSALAILVDLPQYRVPRSLASVIRRLSRPGVWAILAFELAFPVAFASELACTILLVIAFAFHVTNAIVYGLDRFVWAWLAAYPALVYWVQR